MSENILNDILSRTPDKPLYHYTTQSGLLGIIGSRKMWVTHTQYLNDRREFLHAVDLVRDELGNRLKTSSASVTRHQLLQMEEMLQSSPQSINVCVCSFSEEPDLLSQWRAYGGPAGFAIGFPGEFVKEATEKRNWFLAPCIYDLTKQREIARALVEQVLQNPKEEPEQFGGMTTFRELRFGWNLIALLNSYAPILKDESFEEEREWRVISRPLLCDCECFKFREGKSLLVPYSEFPLCYSDLGFHLSQITVGPTRDGDRSRSSIRSFLMHEKVLMRNGSEVPVEISKVPYRDW